MAKKRRASDEFDSPWKDALHVSFQAFLEFFFPDIATDIDWGRGYESLDKELQKIARRPKVGKRLADKLFKVWLNDGSEYWLVVHVEVQGEYEFEFPERMFQYNVAAWQMYNRDVISLAVLCDDQPDWRPATFGYGRWGCKTEVIFRVVKLLDYAEDLARLETSDNPFAVVVLAHRKARETRDDASQRKDWKLRIVKGLYQRDWSKERILQLFHFIDMMMALPEEFERSFDADLTAFEEEKKVKYVTSIERNALKRGLEQGLEEGLMEGISTLLEAKFGPSGLRLLPKVKSLRGLAQLRTFARFVKDAHSIAEVRDYLK